jgi:hypothetical protein
MLKNDKLRHSLNITSEMKNALNQAIKQCPLSRIQIADRMNELMEEEGMEKGEVTTDMINSWTKDDPRRIIPIKFIPFFCRATNSILPLAALAQPMGVMVIGGKEIEVLELGFAELERLRVKQRKVVAMARLDLVDPEIKKMLLKDDDE